MFKVQPLPRKLEAARRDLLDANTSVRLSVARDLAVGDVEERGERVAMLVELLGDAEPSVRRQALLSLADQAATEASARIADRLADNDPGVRQMALLALGEVAALDDEEVRGRVRGLLSAAAPQLRFQALSAWARLSAEELPRAALEALDDSDPEVRRLALGLYEEWLLERPEVRPEAGWLSRLAQCAEDADFGVALAAQLLGHQLGLEMPADALVEVVNRRRSGVPPRDVQLAIEICGRQRLAASRVGLRRRAFGLWGVTLDPFRYQALAGLVALGDPRAQAKMERGLLRGGFRERTLLVFAIGQVGLSQFLPALSAWRGTEDRVDQEVLLTALARLGEAGSEGVVSG